MVKEMYRKFMLAAVSDLANSVEVPDGGSGFSESYYVDLIPKEELDDIPKKLSVIPGNPPRVKSWKDINHDQEDYNQPLGKDILKLCKVRTIYVYSGFRISYDGVFWPFLIKKTGIVFFLKIYFAVVRYRNRRFVKVLLERRKIIELIIDMEDERGQKGVAIGLLATQMYGYSLSRQEEFSFLYRKLNRILDSLDDSGELNRKDGLVYETTGKAINSLLEWKKQELLEKRQSKHEQIIVSLTSILALASVLQVYFSGGFEKVWCGVVSFFV